MDEKMLVVLNEIKKELQDIRGILEPKKVKIKMGDKVLCDPNQENCY